MKIKQEVLDVINKPVVRSRIAVALRVGEQNIYQHMRLNESNGRLTKMDALQIISQITGVPVMEILEEVAIEVDRQDTLSN